MDNHKHAVRVTAFRVVRPYLIDLTFSDGAERRVDLSAEINRGPVFELLRDPAYFAKALMEGDTVAWPNGADFAPEFLYEDAKEFVEA